MGDHTKTCDMGGCEAQAVIELSSHRIDGPMGWRRGIACKDHALSVANWVAHDFDDMQYLKPIAMFNHVTRTWEPVIEEDPHEEVERLRNFMRLRTFDGEYTELDMYERWKSVTSEEDGR